MDIVVTGATGFIGRRLIGVLRGRGHAVTALVRDPLRARALLGEGVPCVAWDASQPRGEWEAAVVRAGAVFNLAGEPIGRRWTDAARARILDSRVLSTRHIVDAMLRGDAPGRVLINSSGINHYGDTGDRVVDETSPASESGFVASVTRAWEAEAERAGVASGGAIREVRLRTGIVLGEAGGAIGQMVTPFKLFVGGTVGSGQQWVSWLHIDDALGLALLALERDAIRGPLNLVAPEPVRMRDFARSLGRALHRPAWLPVPAFALRAAMGEMSQLALESVRAVPRVAREAGYVWKHPELSEALADVFGAKG